MEFKNDRHIIYGQCIEESEEENSGNGISDHPFPILVPSALAESPPAL